MDKLSYCKCIKNKRYRDCLSCLLSVDVKDKGVKMCIKEIIKSREFDKVIEKATKQNIAQIVYHNLLRLGFIQYVEYRAKNFLENIYAKHIARNVLLRNELTQVLKILGKNEIQVMLLKGAGSILERYYSDAPIRFMRDIDLYVRSDDLQRASKCLYNAGYKEYFQEHTFHRVFYKQKEIPCYIELHYLPTSEALINYFKSVDLWQEATMYKTPETIFYIPSPTHLFYYKLIHDTLLHKRLFRLNYSDLYDGATMIKYYGNRIHWNELLGIVKNNCLDLNLEVYTQAIIANGLFYEIERYVPVSKKARKYVDWIYSNTMGTRSICAKERFIYIHYESQNFFDFVLKSWNVLWNTYVLNEDINILVSLYPKVFKNKRATVPFMIIKGIHFFRLLVLHGIVAINYLMRTLRN